MVLPGREDTIEEMILKNNELNQIENGTFDKFTSLKVLKIIENELKTIDESVLTPELGKTLIDLDLASNEIRSLSPTTFQHLTQLESLSLYANFRLKITNELLSKSLANLKSLNLGFCDIDFDEDVFENLP